jgi:hypothetical protein
MSKVLWGIALQATIPDEVEVEVEEFQQLEELLGWIQSQS